MFSDQYSPRSSLALPAGEPTHHTNVAHFISYCAMSGPSAASLRSGLRAFGERPVTSAGGARPRPADHPPGQVPPQPPMRTGPDRIFSSHFACRISPESQVRPKLMGRAQCTWCTVWHLRWTFWHRIFCSTASLASRAPAFEASRIHFPTIGWPRLVRPRSQRTLNNPGATCGNFLLA